ncbi:MAG: S8 family serine peptidase [Acidobacteria bacterium]|nr:S8 family serine peptidase [Acidobacteriota bacterium]
MHSRVLGLALILFVVVGPASAGAAGQAGDRVTVKFADGTGVRLREGRLVSIAGRDLAPLEHLLARFAAEPSRLSDLPEARLDDLRRAAETGAGKHLPDMNLYFELAVPAGHDAQLAEALEALDLVEVAYPSPAPAPPPGDIPPETPDFRWRQGYPLVAPGGIDAPYAWNLPGGRGEGVFVIDIEYDWYDTHEDLEAALGQKLVYVPAGYYPEHGTAVLGELIARDDRWGVTGLVPAARVGMITQYPVNNTNSVARAILAATDLQGPGDVMLLEAQTSGPNGQYCPVEWNQAEFDAISLATGKGIVVVEAAGNGSQNLDSPIFLDRFNRGVRDSGAIIVGAGATPSSAQPDRSRLSFSCYGSRVDVQGWGELVATTGYGGLFAGDAEHRQDYTSTFNGTSSASPVVTGAAVALQGFVVGRGDPPLPPTEVRRILVQTGTPQQAGPYTGKIGPRPNLRAAIRSLSGLVYDSHALADPAPGGNGDGVLDPGETTLLRVCLHNGHDVPAADVAARLVNPHPSWLKVIADTAAVGNLAPGETACAASDFRVVVQPDAPCGQAFRFGLALSSSLGPESSAVRLTVGRDGTCTPLSCPDPLPGEVAPALTLSPQAAADLRLAWPAASGASGYRVWRATRADFADERFAGSPAPGETTLVLPNERTTTDTLVFYEVRAINTCNWEGP